MWILQSFWIENLQGVLKLKSHFSISKLTTKLQSWQGGIDIRIDLSTNRIEG